MQQDQVLPNPTPPLLVNVLLSRSPSLLSLLSPQGSIHTMMMILQPLLLLLLLAITTITTEAFQPSHLPSFPSSSQHQPRHPIPSISSAASSVQEKTKTEPQKTPSPTSTASTPWRRLGSFETLLARKAAQGPTRLSIPHVCVALIQEETSNKLTENVLKPALISLVHRHPLLRACIQGTNKVEDAPVAGVRIGAKEVDPYQWRPSPLSVKEVVEKALSVEQVMMPENEDGDADDFSSLFAKPFQAALDETDLDPAEGPLWRLRVLRPSASSPSSSSSVVGLLFIFNHAISDQTSCNVLIHELLELVGTSSASPFSPWSQETHKNGKPFPPSIEEATLGPTRGIFNINTIKYALREGLLGALPTTILPHPSRQQQQQPAAAADPPFGLGLPAATRKTICEFRRLDKEDFSLLMQACKKRGLTVTAALSAAMLYATSDFAHAPEDESWHSYRLLLSLNMRAFSLSKTARTDTHTHTSKDWAEDDVASAAGALNYLAKVKVKSGKALLQEHQQQEKHNTHTHTPTSTSSRIEAFWSHATHCRQEYLDFVAQGYVPESVRLFDFGMQSLELNEVVEKEAENPKTLGRAYTCGVSNMGVFVGGGGRGERRKEGGQAGNGAAAGAGGKKGKEGGKEQDSEREGVRYGPYALQGIHYATSHSLTGSIYQLSCGTVGGRLCLTLHYAWPIVDRETAGEFADGLVKLLQHVARMS